MIRYSLRFSRSTSLAGLALVAGLAGATSAARAQSAAEIVAANIDATGAIAMTRIENITSSGHLLYQTPFLLKLEGTIEAIRVPGRGYFETVQLGPISQQKGWDGEHSWERGPTGLRMLEGYDAATLALQSFPNTFVALRKLAPAGLAIERLDDADISGRPQNVLAVSTDGPSQTTVYLDQQTHLVTRSVTVPKPGETPVVVDLGDYQAVADVMMPTALTITVEGDSTVRLTLDTTVVNTNVDDSIFDMPVELELGARR